MRVIDDLVVLDRDRPTILTIGAFDGVHRGHQFLMGQIVDRARQLDYASMVVTFDPRPQVVLRPGSAQLTGPEVKTRVIGAVGPEVLAILPFTRQFSEIPAGEFLTTLLDHVNLAEIWLGADFFFGHNREGDVHFLIREGQKRHFSVMVVPRQRLFGQPISSTLVRTLVHSGETREASRFLGHYFGFAGPVTQGFGRGSELGYPTANVKPSPHQDLPGIGVYAGYVTVHGRRLPAAISVGFNVVFGGERVVVEAYVLDFEGDLRGETVELGFVARVSDEEHFETIDELVAKIARDVEAVRRILAETPEPGEIVLRP